MGWVDLVVWSAQAIVDFLVPDSCHLCRRPVDSSGEARARLFGPARCLDGETTVRILGVLPIVNRPFCRVCLSRLVPSRRASRLGMCGESGGAGWVSTADGGFFVHRPETASGAVPCAPSPDGAGSPLNVCSPFRMDDATLEITRCIKFARRRSLVPLAAAAIEYALRTQVGTGGISALVPVPMHPSALRLRGFNQAALLAEALACRTGLPVVSGALVKTTRTPRQSQTIRPRRAENVRGVFRWKGRSAGGRHLCLVDDLVTTGATAASCASVMMAAGARKVTVACLAKAL